MDDRAGLSRALMARPPRRFAASFIRPAVEARRGLRDRRIRHPAATDRGSVPVAGSLLTSRRRLRPTHLAPAPDLRSAFEGPAAVQAQQLPDAPRPLIHRVGRCPACQMQGVSILEDAVCAGQYWVCADRASGRRRGHQSRAAAHRHAASVVATSEASSRPIVSGSRDVCMSPSTLRFDLNHEAGLARLRRRPWLHRVPPQHYCTIEIVQ
jgi:hypothetical protein